MQIQKNHLNDLILLGLSEASRYHSPSVTAFKTGANLSTSNRAIIDNTIDPAQLMALDKFYAGTPYTLWINETDNEAKNLALQQGFSKIFSFPMMALDMAKLQPRTTDSNITIRLVKNDTELFTIWTSILARSYAPDVTGDKQKNFITQLNVFVQYQQKALGDKISFYLGCWDDVPVATGMFVSCPGFVGVHWIGTLPEFRNRGIGFAITSLPLLEYKKNGADTALLFASEKGLPVYEKMGFETVARLEVFARQ